MLNIILAALPALGSLIAGGRSDALIAAGAKVAQEVFGTTSETEIAAKLQNDPALAEQFKAKLAAETEQLQIESRNYELQVQDAADARASNLALASSGSGIAWSGPVIDLVVVIGFFVVLGLVTLRPVTMDQSQFAVANILLGTLATAFVQIINYHRGSSAGSAVKDRMLQTLNQESTTTAARVAAKVVEAAAGRR